MRVISLFKDSVAIGVMRIYLTALLGTPDSLEDPSSMMMMIFYLFL